MEFKKIFWGIRFILYKCILGKTGAIGYLGKPLILKNPKNIILGNKVRIYPNARIECHDGGRLIIEDNVSIGQNVHITCGREDLIIKSGTTITGNVFITNIDHDYEDISKPILEQGYKVKTTIIGNDCFIGFSAGIMPGTILGKHCVVGAHTLVSKKYENFSVIAGCPAKKIKQYDESIGKWIKYG